MKNNNRLKKNNLLIEDIKILFSRFNQDPAQIETDFPEDVKQILYYLAHNITGVYPLFLRDILEYEGVKSYSPVQVLEGCVKIGLIEDKEYWSDIFKTGYEFRLILFHFKKIDHPEIKDNLYEKLLKYIPIIEDHFNTILKKYNLE